MTQHRLRRSSAPHWRKAFGSGAAALCAVLSGCAAGPDYHRPDIATPAVYSGLGDAKSDPLSRPAPVEADLSQWWLQFNDPTLNGLIARALAENLNLKAAVAQLRQAREAQIIALSAGLPQLSSTAAVARMNANSRQINLDNLGQAVGASGGAGGGGQIFNTPSHLNLFTAAFDATWEIDIFGGFRRGVEEAKANTEAAVWQKRDGEVSLTAEVASDYVMLRMLQQQIAIARSEADTQASNFTIVQQQAQTGFVTRLNINQQDAQVEATIAEIPQLQAQAGAQIHALSVLLGLSPEALDQELSATGPLPSPPKTLPVGLPSDLLRRRPDIRRAERQLASATAGVGVQVADLYPKFNILAAGPTFISTSTAHLLDINNAASVGAGVVQWPIFQGGRVRAAIRSARAQQDQAYFTYRQTILGALQNVEDALARCQADQQRLIPLQRSAKSAENSVTISQQQFKVGLVTFINVLQAQNTLLNARNQLIQANADLARDLASLYTALGGGWTADEGQDLRKPGVSWP